MSTDWLARELSIVQLRLKKDELNALGSNMARAWPVAKTPANFHNLLHAIDEADSLSRTRLKLIEGAASSPIPRAESE